MGMTDQVVTAGLAGTSRHACVALAALPYRVGVCEQQRVTRIPGAGSNPSGLPDEALDLLLNRFGCTRADVGRYAAAEASKDAIEGRIVQRLDHHLAHASAAYLSSPFSSATIVVCDQEAPKVSVWRGRGSDITELDWPWHGVGFTDLYSACAATLGFSSGAGEQRLEALARLRPDHRDECITAFFGGDGYSLVTEPGWQSAAEILVRQALARGGMAACAGIAAALQGRVAELFLYFLGLVKQRTDDDYLCLAGSLFYHSSINTIAKQSGLFTDVFVPVDCGNPGLAVGTALHSNHSEPQLLSPFLGPAYDAMEIKATLDNCKLQYDWKNDNDLIEATVNALRSGMIVAWFEGPMEWGPRALGARSLLANPFSPYVLENLNAFLKRREPWRGYALSAIETSIQEHFVGPAHAPFMECDYRPRDAATFRHVLPAGDGAVRIHSVDRRSPQRFTRLLEAFGSVTGLPFLVNTSFNGFHEPLVCSPRDAVRVFYGSGVDMLVLEQFVLAK
jgi:carbamoyltransferase